MTRLLYIHNMSQDASHERKSLSDVPRQSLQATFILGVLAWIGALAIKTWQAR